MAAAVDIYVREDGASAPIEGATVVALADATKVITSIIQTDAEGKASFAAPAGAYEIRLFKTGVVFGKPSRILALEGNPASNTFDLFGHLLTLPVAIDPRVCRCTGRFVDISNRPQAGMTVRIMPLAEEGFQEPEVVDGDQVVGGYVRELRTGQDGRVTVDLLRSGKYHITWAGEDNTSWPFVVPDRLSANLIDLIRPAPKTVTWDSTVAPGGVLTLAVGQTVEVPISVLFGDFTTVTEGLCSWLQAPPNPNVLAKVDGGLVVISGVMVGSSLVQLSTLPIAPLSLPMSRPLPSPLTVVVTP